MADTSKIVEELSNLTVLEVADLVKELEDKWGVSAAAPAAVAVAAPGAESGGAEEKDSFDVVLTGDGGAKIQVIKAVREVVPGLGLADAKKLVEGAPETLKEGATKEEAEEMKKKLEDAGASVELK